MTLCEALEDQACNLGIDVLTENIPVQGMTAAYYRSHTGRARIIVEPSALSQRTCDLAEELGHHCTGDNRLLKYDGPDDWKAEARARRWAHDRLLSPDAIRQAAHSSTDIYELADTLGVTEQFLREAIDDYMARGLWAET